jgi:hypothetical protein
LESNSWDKAEKIQSGKVDKSNTSSSSGSATRYSNPYDYYGRPAEEASNKDQSSPGAAAVSPESTHPPSYTSSLVNLSSTRIVVDSQGPDATIIEGALEGQDEMPHNEGKNESTSCGASIPTEAIGGSCNNAFADARTLLEIGHESKIEDENINIEFMPYASIDSGDANLRSSDAALASPGEPNAHLNVSSLGHREISKWISRVLPCLLEIARRGGRYRDECLEVIRPSLREAISDSRESWMIRSESPNFENFMRYSEMTGKMLVADGDSWEKDNASKICQICSKEFGNMTSRRHHCRSCGILCCGECSSKRMTLSSKVDMMSTKRLSGGATGDRTCDGCFNKLNHLAERPLVNNVQVGALREKALDLMDSLADLVDALDNKLGLAIPESPHDVVDGRSSAHVANDGIARETNGTRNEERSLHSSMSLLKVSGGSGYGSSRGSNMQSAAVQLALGGKQMEIQGILNAIRLRKAALSAAEVSAEHFMQSAKDYEKLAGKWVP